MVVNIYIDWGTSNLRAWMVDRAGKVLKRHTSDTGLLAASEQGFAKVYEQVIEAFDAPMDSSALIFGMAGSRNGWVEVPYTPTPAGAEAIARQAAPVPECSGVRLLGGVQHDSDAGPEVMRGEEVQALGVMQLYPDARLLCLPGTHTKWVEVDGNVIRNFSTFVTGELFAWLTGQSLISTQIDGKAFDPDGFVMGCDLARERRALTSALFQLRTRFLAGSVGGSQVFSMASGLLIGHEIGSLGAHVDGPVYVCAAASLAESYHFALQRFGLESVCIDPEVASLAGLQKLGPHLA